MKSISKLSTISVIIPSFNGAHKILKTIEALLNQSIRAHEIIIVIDGSTDNSLEILKPYIESGAVNVIYHSNSGRAVSRNVGAKKAKNELLVFIDDDIVTAENCLEKHLDFHNEYKEAILAGNPLENKVWCEIDIQHYKRSLSLKWANKYKNGLNKLSKENLFFTAANCSITKDNFINCEGFDERLKDIEDYDFAIRALKFGCDVYFDKSNIAWHNEQITCKSYIQRRRQYKKAIEYLISLKPEYISFLLKSGKVSFLKRTFLGLFSLKVWPQIIDNDDLVFVPKKIRYKIYEWVIFSLGEVYVTRNF